MKTAYFAGGCFWCITPIFKSMAGVDDVVCGYSGGDSRPTYDEVKSQTTAHRETIAVTYDENAVSYKELLDIFIGYIDPFDEGGQFIDRGRSYTTAVFYCDETERILAETALRDLEKNAKKRVCVCVEPFVSFFVAEEYHQDYYLKNPEAFDEELKKSGRKGKKIETSCGAVVFTAESGDVKYVIIRSVEGIYGFPKGHMEAGETKRQTAIREIKEETGLDVMICDGFSVTQEYPLPKKPDTLKRVHFFLAKYAGQKIVYQKEELSAAFLLPFEDAVNALSFDNQREVISAANDFIKSHGLDKKR